MRENLLRSNALRAMVIAYVMIASSFVLLVDFNVASAQTAADTQLVVGLQNPATSENFFDVATNTVWKAYMLEFNFEALYTYDPDSAIYSDLANSTAATNCPAGQTPGPYTGMCHSADFFNFTVQMHTNITFTDGQPLTADDVVFSYQTLPWSTYAPNIYQALWWPQPIVPLWNSSTYGGSCTASITMPYACMSHVAVKKVSQYSVGFQLIPVTLPDGTKGAYSLFFYATLGVVIIPKHIWTNHMQSTPSINYSSSSNAPVSDTFDRSINTGYSANDATIGTGPFLLTSWAQPLQTIISIYPNYWAKGIAYTWKGTSYPFFPAYVQSVKYQVFSSLDVVSLALQQGTIDTLVWSLTPGFYSQVKANPSITVTTITDSGFFYMSFNMRKHPWDDLCLRQAISMAIDKNYIVNTLMGGFGIPGTVPISIVNPGYVNTSAAPPSFNLAGISAKLQGCGYTKDPSTGFWKAPAAFGGQIVTATILTPPKDYDPVRADAGIMISNNLKSVGLDINAAPTSFDTIVARGLTGPVDYDIYILGFLLGIFPEGYICSFFCTNQDVNINPAGSNSAGYSNATVDNLIQRLTYTVNTNTRQKLMQDVEGIITNAIPWNILYYRKDLNAFRNDKWAGWVDNAVLNALSAGGGAFNGYSLAVLRPAGTVPVPPPSGALTVATTVPQRVLANHVVPVETFVSLGGLPVSGASISLTASLPSGTVLNTASGTTGATGFAILNWTAPVIQGDIFLTVTATKGTSVGSTTKQLEVTVGPPAPIAQLSLSTPTPVILKGQTATVTATLTDGLGAGISGQTVTIDPTLMLGKISPVSAATDAAGHATFTYTAPANTSLFPNAHLVDTVRATVSVGNTILSDTQTATQTIFVQNNDPENWLLTTVSGTPSLVLGPVTGNSTAITVHVTDFSGTATSGITVAGVLLPGEHNVTVTPASAVTDVSGNAVFTVTNAATWSPALSQNVLLRFQTQGQLFATSDEVALLVTSNIPPGYAARLSFTNRTLPYASTMAQSTVTATVYNQAGVAATGAAVIFQIGYGDLGVPAEFNWALDYNTLAYKGQGLALNAFGQASLGGSFQNSTGQGPAYGVDHFVNDFEVLGSAPDSCAPSTWPTGFNGLYYINSTSLTNTAGQTSAVFRALPMPRDSEVPVIAYIGNANSLRATIDACAFVASITNSMFKIDSGVATVRAPPFGLGSVTTSTPIFDSGHRTTQLTAKFYTVGGAPAPSVQVFVVRGQGSKTANILGAFGGTFTTDASGTLVLNTTVPLRSLSQAYYYSLLPADPRYSYGGREQLFSGFGNPPGAGSLGDFWFSPNFEVLIAKFPFNFQRGYLFVPTTVAFAVAAPLLPVLGLGGTTPVLVAVFTGNTTPLPVAGASVWSGSVQATTNAGGLATFNYTAGLGAAESLVVVTTLDGQVMRAWFGVIALNPILSYGAITPSVAAAGQTSTFTSTVTNTVPVAGNTTVFLVVDGATVAAKQVQIAAFGTATVTFSYVFASAGSHTVAIGTQSTTATVVSPPATLDLVTAYGLAGGLLVAGLVVGVVIGMLLRRRGRKPSASMSGGSGSSGGAKTSEEELGPDEQL